MAWLVQCLWCKLLINSLLCKKQLMDSSGLSVCVYFGGRMHFMKDVLPLVLCLCYTGTRRQCAEHLGSAEDGDASLPDPVFPGPRLDPAVLGSPGSGCLAQHHP